MKYFTGIDIGSTASKVVVLDEAGVVDSFRSWGISGVNARISTEKSLYWAVC